MRERPGLRVAFIGQGFPDRETDGAAMASWAIVKQLAEAGHTVTVCALLPPGYVASESRARTLLNEQGVALRVIPNAFDEPIQSSGVAGAAGRFARMVWPDMRRLSQAACAAPRLKTLLDEIRPDALLLYHWEALAASDPYDRRVPRAMVIGDPVHLPRYYRWRMTPPSLSLRYLKLTAGLLYDWCHQPRLMKKGLATCAFKGELAAHHARWFQARGVRDCEYLRMPVVDEAGAPWRQRCDEATTHRVPRILLVGSMLGTSTLSGLRLFAAHVLPRVERALGPDGFEVRVVGGGTPPADLARRLARPAVKLLGRVESVIPEFISADVLCIPTPVPLGVRTRAIVGFSFGCCVVAHRTNTEGLPEMVHGDNALVASDGSGLADAILQAIRDPALRQRLGANARKTYETYFHPQVAAQRIVEKVEASTQ